MSTKAWNAKFRKDEPEEDQHGKSYRARLAIELFKMRQSEEDKTLTIWLLSDSIQKMLMFSVMLIFNT